MIKALTLKSTPIVALASSSGNHCSSENLSNRLLLPTLEFPISSNFTFIGDVEVFVTPIGAIIGANSWYRYTATEKMEFAG